MRRFLHLVFIRRQQAAAVTILGFLQSSQRANRLMNAFRRLMRSLDVLKVRVATVACPTVCRQAD